MRYLIAYIQRRRRETMSGDPPIDNHIGEDPLDVLMNKIHNGDQISQEGLLYLAGEIRGLMEDRVRMFRNEQDLYRKLGELSDELGERHREITRLNASLASKDADLKLINSSLADIQKQLEAWKEENDAARQAIHRLEIRRESSGHPQEGTVKG